MNSAFADFFFLISLSVFEFFLIIQGLLRVEKQVCGGVTQVKLVMRKGDRRLKSAKLRGKVWI